MKSFLSNTAFDILKWLAILALPAIADFIKFVFPIWDIPYADPIAETIRQVALLIGILVGVSTIGYIKNNNNNNTVEIETIQKDLEDTE